MPGPGSRRPRAVYGQGQEPDARFSLANERTALAWVRTALACVAGGIGLTSVARVADLPRLVDALAVVLCLLGGVLAVSAVAGWRRREIALRTGRPMSAPVALPWLAGVVAVAALVLALVASLQR